MTSSAPADRARTAGAAAPREPQRLIDALRSPIRREILWMAWDRELAAGDVVESFDLSAATISGHLKVLHEAGLLTRRVDGTFRRYRTDRDAVAGVRHLLTDDAAKWRRRTTEGPQAAARLGTVAIVSTDAPCDRVVAFNAFTDAERYEQWAAMPVTLVDGYFTAELGERRIRGRYDHVVEPSLIVMTWDFATDEIPVPGRGLRAFLELTDTPTGCRLELHQLADNDEQARFLARVWGLLLARFREHLDTGPKPRRPHGASRQRGAKLTREPNDRQR